MPTKPRILLYSHDTYGLGHLRRTLAVAGQLHRDIPNVHQLVITGSMVAGAFGLPPRLDLVKLPALSKRSSGAYKARALPLSLRQTVAWREEMILQAVRAFNPHLVLVDKVAAGVQGELLPALRYLKTWHPHTRLVLGMRDIEDSPQVTRAEWAASRAEELMDRVYDRLLLYGQREVFDPVTAYDMSPTAAGKLVECGYLRPTDPVRSRTVVRRELGLSADGRPLVVVTVGGGGDGFAILKAYLEMLEVLPTPLPFHSLLITGPLMAEGKRTLLRRLLCPGSRPEDGVAMQGEDWSLLEFTPDLLSYLAAADLVVSMAGYNTVCELMALRQRAVLIPRVQVREEQCIRAVALASRGLAGLLLPGDLSAARLAASLSEALAAPPPDVDLPMDGLTTATHVIRELLEESLAPRPQARVPRISNGAGRPLDLDLAMTH